MKTALVLATALFASSAGFAQQITVTGRVELSGTASSPSADSSSAVVWLTPIGKAPVQLAGAQSHVQLLQKKKTFSPHLLVVPVGTPVEFPNQDPFFHNVFSLFEGKRFDLGLYEAGSSRSVVFNREGVSYIFCNIHPEMSAVVVALKTLYHGISDRSGLVTIQNVSSGTYDMEVWHERVLPETLSSARRRIEISAAASSLGTIHLQEKRNLSQTHKNKYGRDYDSATPNGPIYVRP